MTRHVRAAVRAQATERAQHALAFKNGRGQALDDLARKQTPVGREKANELLGLNRDMKGNS